MVAFYNEHKAGRTKVFLVIKDKEITSVITGNRAVVKDEAGIQFYVDDYVAEQIHKFNLKMDGFEPKLELKEGETLFVPEENDEYKRQKEIEELEQKLKELKGGAE